MPPLLDLVKILKAERDAGRFRTAGDRSGNLWHFLGPVEIDEDDQTATLLIRRSDKRSPEYGYSDTLDGTLRVLEKGANEGGDAAAHLIVSLKPSEPNTYIAVLEGVAGLNHRNVISLLNNLLSAYYKAHPKAFTFPDPAGAKTKDGEIRQHEFKPRFAMIGHISDQLKQDLENGTIGDIELKTSELHSTVGNDPFLTKKGFKLTVSVSPDIPRDNLLNRIVAALQSKRATYDRAKIHFKDPTGHSKSIEIDVGTGAIEQSYVQAKRIAAIFPPLRMTTDAIVERLADPMRQMLIDYRA